MSTREIIPSNVELPFNADGFWRNVLHSPNHTISHFSHPPLVSRSRIGSVVVSRWSTSTGGTTATVEELERVVVFVGMLDLVQHWCLAVVSGMGPGWDHKALCLLATASISDCSTSIEQIILCR